VIKVKVDENSIKSILKELMDKENIQIEDAVKTLKEATKAYMTMRDEYLQSGEIKKAKDIYPKVAAMYNQIADKMSSLEQRESLEALANFWARSGETEMFIEPSLPLKPPKVVKPTTAPKTMNIYDTLITKPERHKALMIGNRPVMSFARRRVTQGIAHKGIIGKGYVIKKAQSGIKEKTSDIMKERYLEEDIDDINKRIFVLANERMRTHSFIEKGAMDKSRLKIIKKNYEEPEPPYKGINKIKELAEYDIMRTYR
jgi:hypothetical protein